MLTYLKASISLFKLKGMRTHVQVIKLYGTINLKELIISASNFNAIQTYYNSPVMII